MGRFRCGENQNANNHVWSDDVYKRFAANRYGWGGGAGRRVVRDSGGGLIIEGWHGGGLAAEKAADDDDDDVDGSTTLLYKINVARGISVIRRGRRVKTDAK